MLFAVHERHHFAPSPAPVLRSVLRSSIPNVVLARSGIGVHVAVHHLITADSLQFPYRTCRETMKIADYGKEIIFITIKCPDLRRKAYRRVPRLDG